MTIAILAHDSRKELALQFCTAYSGILSRNTVIATGTTGRMLAQATGLPVHCYLSGKLGGIQQISARVACDEVTSCSSSATRSRPGTAAAASRTCCGCAICTASTNSIRMVLAGTICTGVHAVSRDLVHWTHLPIFLEPQLELHIDNGIVGAHSPDPR